MMKKVDKEEQLRKVRKTAERVRKEVKRKEKDRQEAMENRNVRKMIMKWKEEGDGSGTGKTPIKLDIVRNNPEKNNGRTGRSGTFKEESEAEKASQELMRRPESSMNTIGKDKLSNIVRKKETAVVDEMKQNVKNVETVRKEAGTVRKKEDPILTTTPPKGNIKHETNLVRKPGDEEDRKESGRKTDRNKEQIQRRQESCQVELLGAGGAGKKERRNSIRDIIRNYDSMDRVRGG